MTTSQRFYAPEMQKPNPYYAFLMIDLTIRPKTFIKVLSNRCLYIIKFYLDTPSSLFVWVAKCRRKYGVYALQKSNENLKRIYTEKHIMDALLFKDISSS